MNYIQNLKTQIAEKDLIIQTAKEEIQYLRTYLLSDKFHEDTTVQVRDVLNRLNNIEL